jgi:(S)-2-hydroxy-acid oxidase
MQRLTGDEGELGNVRTAVKMGLNMTLSSQSTTSLEDVMAAAREQASGIVSPKLWFQIYLTGDWEKNVKLIQRAEGQSNTPDTGTTEWGC